MTMFLCTKQSSTKTWFEKVGVEDIDCPSQSPDLDLNEHLWDELQHKLKPRPPHMTVPDLTNAAVDE